MVIICRDMYRDIAVQKKMNFSDREFEHNLTESWE